MSICPPQLLWLSFLEQILRTIPPNKASEIWRNDFHVSKSFIRHLWIYHMQCLSKQKSAIQNPKFMGWNNTKMTIYPASKRIFSFLTNGNYSKTNMDLFQHRSWAASRNPHLICRRFLWEQHDLKLSSCLHNEPTDMRFLPFVKPWGAGRIVSGNKTCFFFRICSGIGCEIS